MSNAKAPNYYMIVNIGTLLHSQICQRYPYHMVLAQQWAASEAYRQTISKMQLMDNCRIILDNGAHEGIDIDIDLYTKVVRELEPDVVVLPDLVGRPGDESRALSLKFADALAKQHGCPIKYMFAAQGQDRDDVLFQYDWAMTYLDPKDYIIGLGQAYLQWTNEPVGQDRGGPDWEKPRQKMIEDMEAYAGLTKLQAYQFHLLGARWNPMALFRIYRKLNIVGLDSIKPCTCTFAGTYYPVYKQEKRKLDLCDDNGYCSTNALTLNIDRLVDAYGLQTIDWSKIYEVVSVR